jgi:hypothetical protein
VTAGTGSGAVGTLIQAHADAMAGSELLRVLLDQYKCCLIAVPDQARGPSSAAVNDGQHCRQWGITVVHSAFSTLAPAASVVMASNTTQTYGGQSVVLGLRKGRCRHYTCCYHELPMGLSDLSGCITVRSSSSSVAL